MKECIVISGPDTKLPPEGKECGICLDPFVVPGEKTGHTPVAEIGKEESDINDQTVVYLKPCSQCFFHKECILHWFRGTRVERSTCPNDRSELFVAEPLTEEQVAQRTADELTDYYASDEYEPGSSAMFRIPGREGIYCEEERYILRQVIKEVTSETDISTAPRNENIMVEMLHAIMERLLERSGPIRAVFGEGGHALIQYHVVWDLQVWLLQYRTQFGFVPGKKLREYQQVLSEAIGCENLGTLVEEARLRGFFEAGTSEALTYHGCGISTYYTPGSHLSIRLWGLWYNWCHQFWAG
ncbi:hypothetical protein BDV96DRAFT_651035 [Lophiotrema nucula]|uniref:RING-type domain-containing protein n=1 Tax=Lophiotrema nucula TaxID=690887 RepID=A0A6A5YW97_9PLEO|nr:hypothetical protein BDV96DRAFT_651035 [Lophiotrema nucula]